MCSLRSAFVIAILSLAACEHDSSVGRDNPDAPGWIPDSGSMFMDAAQSPVECMGTKLFAMTGPLATAHVEATKPLTFILGGQTDDIMGAHGELTDGTFFSLFRDGDVSDGDLAQVGTYNVSQYPYNILFARAPQPQEGCEGVPGCVDWLAVAGMFTVTQVKPVYRATFMISMIGEGDSPGGNPIPGSATGCFAVPNP